MGAFFNKDMDITAMGPMADKGFTPENVALSGSILEFHRRRSIKKSRRILPLGNTRIISRCCSCWMSSTASRPFSGSAGTGLQRLNRSSPKSVRQFNKKGSRFRPSRNLAPMTDLVRDARWGRVIRSTGEDPYLNGLFHCTGMVRGFRRRSEGSRTKLLHA